MTRKVGLGALLFALLVLVAVNVEWVPTPTQCDSFGGLRQMPC